MQSILQQIFGTYDITQIVTPIYDESGVLIHTVVEGSRIDFEYIAGVVLFAICLWSFFKLIGAVLKR